MPKTFENSAQLQFHVLFGIGMWPGTLSKKLLLVE